ncbi:bifunctional phosphoribosyl-AMP cyclohydrolase/phosphoribosyl-ATP diphosphatase HisIE [candidate division KSB1 bacterium]|nr:bifunctional phosphoribosyl-AMP cyclohydrolase/phosphoribosyl-ATP diphosphatase HisIE [candidate division KSB1 bacterium]
MNPELLDKIKFDANGLVPAILQDHFTGRVLMLAYMNRASLEKTLATGHCWFYSRSRQELWEKGATSGNFQQVQEIRLDCDGDTLLIRVQSAGPACHTGSVSCFDEAQLNESATATAFFEMVDNLSRLLHERNLKRPEGSYTTKLFNAGTRQIAKKLGEEGVEVALAAVAEADDRFAEEAADLVYNLLVLLEARGVPLNKVGEVLRQRAQG